MLLTRLPSVVFFLAAAIVFSAGGSQADDWPGFRGPSGLALAKGSGLPSKWSDGENIAWKSPLPGPGSSSPIVMGDRIFVTCYSGYGVERDKPGEQASLVRKGCSQPFNRQRRWREQAVGAWPDGESRYSEGGPKGETTPEGQASARSVNFVPRRSLCAVVSCPRPD